MLILVQGYVYILDNMLKMMMIVLRFQFNILVVVMGEIGCGKILFIRWFVDICEVYLNVLSVYVGIREKDILDIVFFVNNIVESNRSEEVWLFFDELNISEYVGFIFYIVCYRELNGNVFFFNLLFIVVCNLY